MAAANKPTAVHFALVFFVMAALILMVTTYLGFKKNSEKEALLTASENEKRDLSTQLDGARSSMEAAQTLLGINLAQWGTDAGDPTQLIGNLSASMQELGGDDAAPTLMDVLRNMRAKINSLEADNASGSQANNQLASELAAVQSDANVRVDEFRQSQESTEQQLQSNIAARQQAIDEKNAEIASIQKQLNETLSLKGQIQDAYDRYRSENEERIALLDKQINFYKDQIDELTKQGFERADGEIVSIDNTTRTVWINLGTAESLRPQISFSVYTHDNRGIGRGVEDIKGKIEVTRILEPHLAEARILDEDLFRPIAEGDPIYSPLWSAGRKEYFAVVGRPDLDEDGKSDIDLFKELVERSGAELELYVNDDAERVPADAKLSARTKFLIIGDLDDPSDFSGIPEKQELAVAQEKQKNALIDEARLYGIRVVRLNDFLDFIGWKPEQRLWRPGEDRSFNLQQGSQSAGVDNAYQDRTSSGNVSEVYRRNRAGQQQSSDGTTSGLYKSSN